MTLEKMIKRTEESFKELFEHYILINVEFKGYDYLDDMVLCKLGITYYNEKGEIKIMDIAPLWF